MAAAAAPLPPTPRPNRLSIDIISVAFRHNSIEHISFLQRKGLLAISITCSCGTQMALGEKSDLSDGHIFRCSSCKTTKSVRHGSFFSKSKLKLSQWIIIIYWWVRQYPVSKAAEESGASRKVTIDIYQWLREVCSTRLLQQRIQLGGPQKIVQIDESLFKHKPKVRHCTCKEPKIALLCVVSISQLPITLILNNITLTMQL